MLPSRSFDPGSNPGGALSLHGTFLTAATRQVGGDQEGEWAGVSRCGQVGTRWTAHGVGRFVGRYVKVGRSLDRLLDY